MTFEDLKREYQTELIGDLIYNRVRTLARRLLRNRDPTVYARGAHDYRDALGDVVNDFAMDVLIGERQIDYIMITSSDLDEFDRLIRRHLRRYLARTRVRTVIDNLIDRSVEALRLSPFEAHGTGEFERFMLSAQPAPADRQPLDAELRLAAALAQAVPKVAAQGEERAPKVYDAEGLRAVLVLLCESVSGPLSRHDLQAFFNSLLTAWAPSFLGPAEELNHADSALMPLEEALVNETAMQIAATMTPEERIIFRSKYANLPDRQVAAALGLSRQSTVPRKQALFERLISELADLERHLQGAVLARIGALIAIANKDVS